MADLVRHRTDTGKKTFVSDNLLIYLEYFGGCRRSAFSIAPLDCLPHPTRGRASSMNWTVERVCAIRQIWRAGRDPALLGIKQIPTQQPRQSGRHMVPFRGIRAPPRSRGTLGAPSAAGQRCGRAPHRAHNQPEGSGRLRHSADVLVNARIIPGSSAPRTFSASFTRDMRS